MRVISGKYRGLVLNEFEGWDVRPTSDRVKESLFNILQFSIQGARVLDLFSGTGGIGIECLSRGAAFVHFNDSANSSLNIIRSNLKKLKGECNFKVTAFDCTACLNTASDKYDFIFIDPPYHLDLCQSLLTVISDRNLLSLNGVVVYESQNSLIGICDCVDNLVITDERKYGRTYLTFFKLKEE